MSAPLPRNILKVPGRLVLNPTSLSSAYPHGGTELGVFRDVVMNFGVSIDYPMAEEFKAPVAAIISEENPVLGCVLRSWDNNALAAAWNNIQTSGGNVGILGKVTGSNRAGASIVSRGVKLFFSPHAVDLHRAILLYNAIPVAEETASLQMSMGREFGLPLIFRALPDSAGRTYAMDLRSNISL